MNQAFFKIDFWMLNLSTYKLIMKKTLSISAYLVSVSFNRSRWDFKYSYSEICARDSVNGNVVVLKVTVIVAKTYNTYFSHCKMFSACENFNKYWNGTYILKNRCVTHIQKKETVFQGTKKNTAFERIKIVITDDYKYRIKNCI